MHCTDSTSRYLFKRSTSRPVKAPSLSDLSRAMWPYRDPISKRKRATVSASLFFTAFISTNFRKLSMATRMYLLPYLSSRLKTMKSYDTSKKGRDTINECFAFIFSFGPLTFWQMGQASRNSFKAAFTFVASPRSFAHLEPQRLSNFL